MRALRGSPAESPGRAGGAGKSPMSAWSGAGTALNAESSSEGAASLSSQGFVAAEPCTERRGGLWQRHPPFGPFVRDVQTKSGPCCQGPLGVQGRRAAAYGSNGGAMQIATVGSQSGLTIPRSARVMASAAGSIAVGSTPIAASPSALSAQAASDQAASLQAASLQAASPQAAEAQAASLQAAEAQAASLQAASLQAASLHAASPQAAFDRAADRHAAASKALAPPAPVARHGFAPASGFRGARAPPRAL